MRSLLLDRRPKLRTGLASKRALERRGLSFRDHIATAFHGEYKFRRFHDELVDAYQDFHDGKLLLPDGKVARRFFAAIEQQTGKSTWWQLAASWEMRRHPQIGIGHATHHRDKALRASSWVRKFYRNSGGLLEEKGKQNWRTVAGGEFWALSTGMSPASMPADLLYLDDLIGDRLQAESEALYKSHLPWMSEMMARRRKTPLPGVPPFRIVVVHTRQGLADIASKFLSLGDYYCVILPTLYAPEGSGLKETWYLGPPMVGPFPAQPGEDLPADEPEPIRNSSLRPDWRKPGEGLDEDDDVLSAAGFEARRTKNNGWIDDPTCAANLQGTPAISSGAGVMQRRWFKRQAERPAGPGFRAWDFGSTKGGGHPSAAIEGCKIGGEIYMRHGCRAWLAPEGVEKLVAAMAILDGQGAGVSIPIPKADGGDRLNAYRRYLQEVFGWLELPPPRLHGQSVATSRPKGDEKTAKFFRIAGQPYSLASRAVPLDWDAPNGDIRTFGSVSVVTTDWRPQMRDIVSGFQGKALAHPELLEIEQLGLAATGQFDERRTKALDVDPLGWQDVSLGQFQNMSPYSDGADDYCDAGGDLAIVLGRPMVIPAVF